jgi:hypothetical protein
VAEVWEFSNLLKDLNSTSFHFFTMRLEIPVFTHGMVFTVIPVRKNPPAAGTAESDAHASLVDAFRMLAGSMFCAGCQVVKVLLALRAFVNGDHIRPP